VKRGRAFDDRDRAGATPVVVINEAMAHQFWQNADPLNDRIVIGRGVMREFAAESERQIVGIVGDTRDGGLNSDPQPTMYVPQAQLPDAANALNVRLTPMAWVVRTQGEPHAFSQPIQQALKEAVGLPVTDVRSMDEVVSLSTSRQRFNMWLMSVFGAAALLLASIGIYGLMAYSVEQRTQEIGIRLALGARVADVRRMVIVQGGRLALVGIVIGVASAFALVHFISSISALLFGVAPADPLVFAGVPLLLMVVSLASVAVPALRASRVSPIIAMRAE
jgi:predicted lysophospholipase L1 biosynthesis ABC-type transport system permease subunit